MLHKINWLQSSTMHNTVNKNRFFFFFGFKTLHDMTLKSAYKIVQFVAPKYTQKNIVATKTQNRRELLFIVFGAPHKTLDTRIMSKTNCLYFR